MKKNKPFGTMDRDNSILIMGILGMITEKVETIMKDNDLNGYYF